MEGFIIFASLFSSAVVISIPLLLGTVGEIITEKSGSLNLGVEGMMAIGGLGGYLAACTTDSLFMGIFVGFLVAALCGLLFAFLTVTLRANQNVTGLAMTIFGVGLYRFIGQTLNDQLHIFPTPSVNLLQKVAENGIPGLRDIPYIGKLFFSYNVLVYIAIAIAIVCWIYLRHTKSGLRLNSIGENPAAADAVGVNITAHKYLNIILGAGITGIGGFYLGIITQSSWNDGWINGYGWIAIALVIFANWNTMSAIFGSVFFGLLMHLRIKSGDIILAFPEAFGWMKALPPEFYQMLPFIITAIVLIVTSMSKRKKQSAPAALGINYYREDR